MLKTMKPSEVSILFDEKDGILLDYGNFLAANPDSLLIKMLGVYKVQVNESDPIILFVSENMVGNDFGHIRHMYDLKGSTFKRHTELSEEEKANSGLKVLKCMNMANDETRLEVSTEAKNKVLAILEQDS